jgi:hypothetical protein
VSARLAWIELSVPRVDCAVLRNDHHPAARMTEHGMAAGGPLVSLRAAAFQSATGRVDFKDDVATGEFLDREHIDV